MTYELLALSIFVHTYYSHYLTLTMDNATDKHYWTNNADYGQVTGELISTPEELLINGTPIAHCMLIDSNKCKWRIRCASGLARQLLQLPKGDKVKLTGIKGSVRCWQSAYFQAKRQIVPDRITLRMIIGLSSKAKERKAKREKLRLGR